MGDKAPGSRETSSTDAASRPSSPPDRCSPPGLDNQSLQSLFGEGSTLPWLTTRGPSMSLLQSGNLAMQSSVAPAEKRRPPVEMKLYPLAPWKAMVDPASGWTEISMELYGIDLSSMFKTDEGDWGVAKSAGKVCLELFVELLKPRYADEFHSKMETELSQDTSYVEEKLMETWVDDDDESSILGRVRWWSGAEEVRDRNGVTYFDRFLGRLESDRYYTDYYLTQSGRASFLSLLHEEIEDDAGDLVDMIANNSERFGAFRPTTLFPSVSREADRSSLTVNRVTDQILDRMVGFTSGSDERGIVGMVTGMPGGMQARVLEDLMTRTSERRGIFSRTGEQTGEGMLYFLFEDLEEDDRKKMGADLVAKGVLKQEAVDSLVERRTWAGRNLPWSTKLGSEAAQFWAERYNESDNTGDKIDSFVMGSLASLWTPETAGTTIVVLATANPSGIVGTTIARAPVVIQEGLLVAGTGLGAYQATTSTIAAVSGEDASGNSLSSAERVAKAIEAVSTVLMLGAGFHSAGHLRPRTPLAAVEAPALAGVRDSPLLAPTAATSGGQQRVAWRITAETVEGEITAVGINHATGEVAVVNINKYTGDGSVFSPAYGRANIVGGRPQAPRAALEAGAESAGVIRVSPDVEVLPPGSGGGQKTLASRDPKLLEAPKYEDISGEIQQHIDEVFGKGPTAWRVAPDGTAFTVPPESLKPLPIHVPDGPVPPGEIFSGRDPQPVLVGPLREGFTPFEVFPTRVARTTHPLSRVRQWPGQVQERGNVGSDYVAELHGGRTKQDIALPERITKTGMANPNQGLREADALAPALPGKTLNLESKNYLRFINGRARTFNEVSPDARLRGEIWRDAMVHHYYPDHQSVWVFVGAPPSPALAAELANAGIPWMAYSDAIKFYGAGIPRGLTP